MKKGFSGKRIFGFVWKRNVLLCLLAMVVLGAAYVDNFKNDGTFFQEELLYFDQFTDLYKDRSFSDYYGEVKKGHSYYEKKAQEFNQRREDAVWEEDRDGIQSIGKSEDQFYAEPGTYAPTRRWESRMYSDHYSNYQDARQYLKEIETRIQSFKRNIKRGAEGYDARMYEKAINDLQKIRKIGENEVYDLRYFIIDQYIDLYIDPTLLLLVFLLFFCYSKIAGDAQRRMTGLFATTKFGLRRMVYTKLGVACLMTTILVLGYSAVRYGCIIINTHDFPQFSVFTAPVQCLPEFTLSTQNLTVWQWMVISTVCQWIGALFFSVLFVFISMLTRNNIVSFFVNLLVAGIPYTIGKIAPDYTQKLYNPVALLNPEYFINDAKYVNLLGIPVPALLFVYTVCVVLTIVLLYLCGKLCHRAVKLS